jgi:hypothetical protein
MPPLRSFGKRKVRVSADLGSKGARYIQFPIIAN